MSGRRHRRTTHGAAVTATTSEVLEELLGMPATPVAARDSTNSVLPLRWLAHTPGTHCSRSQRRSLLLWNRLATTEIARLRNLVFNHRSIAVRTTVS